MDRERNKERSPSVSTSSLLLCPISLSLPTISSMFPIYLFSIKHVLDIHTKGGFHEMEVANTLNGHLTERWLTADGHKKVVIPHR